MKPPFACVGQPCTRCGRAVMGRRCRPCRVEDGLRAQIAALRDRLSAPAPRFVPVRLGLRLRAWVRTPEEAAELLALVRRCRHCGRPSRRGRWVCNMCDKRAQRARRKERP